jgi:hypothetical protein
VPATYYPLTFELNKIGTVHIGQSIQALRIMPAVSSVNLNALQENGRSVYYGYLYFTN